MSSITIFGSGVRVFDETRSAVAGFLTRHTVLRQFFAWCR